MKIEINTALMVLRDGEPVGSVKDFLNSLVKDTSLDGWQRSMNSEDLDDAVYAAPEEERDRLMPYLILYRLVELYEAREAAHAARLESELARQGGVMAQASAQNDATWQARLDAATSQIAALTAPPERTPEEQEAIEVEQRAQAMVRELRIRTAAEERFKALATEAGLSVPAP